jgi:hypothetical protein
MRIAIMVLAVGLMPLWAQEIKLPASVEKLSEKAEESVVVTLDSNMLRLLAKFDKGTADDASRKLIGGLESIYVRSFQFAWEDEYKLADVEAIRSQLQAPTWSRIVGVRSKNSEGDVDVYFKDGGNGKLAGIVVIAAEPRELTFVSIVGSLEPGQLADLGGQFHIPKLEMALGGGRRKEWK